MTATRSFRRNSRPTTLAICATRLSWPEPGEPGRDQILQVDDAPSRSSASHPGAIAGAGLGAFPDEQRKLLGKKRHAVALLVDEGGKPVGRRRLPDSLEQLRRCPAVRPDKAMPNTFGSPMSSAPIASRDVTSARTGRDRIHSGSRATSALVSVSAQCRSSMTMRTGVAAADEVRTASIASTARARISSSERSTCQASPASPCGLPASRNATISALSSPTSGPSDLRKPRIALRSGSGVAGGLRDRLPDWLQERMQRLEYCRAAGIGTPAWRRLRWPDCGGIP